MQMKAIPLFLVTCLLAQPAAAQVDLTVNEVGLAIGDTRRTTGVRLNFRDDKLERVRGINATIWSPYEPAGGAVDGIAIGLPLTGAHTTRGAAVALGGVSATESLTGLGVGGLGIGAGNSLKGIMIGGLGVGTGGTIEGLGVSLVGLGAGGGTRGIMIGGLAVGSGGSVRGLTIGGIGVGAGGGASGITLAGIGVGTGGSIRGLTISGIGVGSGGSVTGVTVAGVGAAAGGRLRGITVAGAGIGAPEIEGLGLTLGGVGGQQVRGVFVAGVHLKVVDDGHFRGAGMSAFSKINGRQDGLTIGLINYARELNGVQIGAINISENGGNRRILPVINIARAP